MRKQKFNMRLRDIKQNFEDALYRYVDAMPDAGFERLNSTYFESRNFKDWHRACKTCSNETLLAYCDFLKNSLERANGNDIYIAIRTPFFNITQYYLKKRGLLNG